MPELTRRCLLLLAVLIAGCTTGRSGVSGAGPQPLGSGEPTATALASPSATASRSLAAAATPAATPTPDPALLELAATSCQGGVVLNWSASRHPEFHHYTALRSPEREIAPAYPPIAPAVDWGDTYATDPFVTSAVDASIIPSETEWHYRVMAYDAQGRVVSASPVRTARLLEVAELGELRATDAGEGITRLGWMAFDGDGACFTSYHVLYGTGGPPSTVLSVISDQGASAIETDALHPGTTYQLRIEVVRHTTLGGFTVAETDTVSYTVP